MRKLIAQAMASNNGCETSRELRESLDASTRESIDPDEFDRTFQAMHDQGWFLRCTMVGKWSRYFLSPRDYDHLERMQCET